MANAVQAHFVRLLLTHVTTWNAGRDMVFSSVIFIFYFLPAFLFCYYILPFKQATLLVFSLLFYAFGELIYTYVMICSICLNYVFGLWIDRSSGKNSRFAISISVLCNLVILCYFKYLAFAFSIIAPFIPNADAFAPSAIHLPLGISFFTFHAISYLVDVYRRQVPVERNLSYLAVYITMFPQLVAGPIIRFHNIRDEIHNRRVNLRLFSDGVQIFIIGLSQKVLIANPIALVADQIFALDPAALSASVAWLGIVCYTLQIYFDFCGYSTMAIGLGLMMGFHFPLNFDYPYISRSVTEFWRRWHISLSSWFRDYVYIPLGGNRVGPWTTYRNLIIVFALCGLWHGPSWNFLIWGLWHGGFLVIERLGLGAWLGRILPVIQHGYAMTVVMIGWVFFRSDTLGQSLSYLRAMTRFSMPSGVSPTVSQFVTPELIIVMVVGMVASTPVLGRLVTVMLGRAQEAQRPIDGRLVQGGEAVYLLGLFALFALAVMSLAAGTYNPFIYFRF